MHCDYLAFPSYTAVYPDTHTHACTNTLDTAILEFEERWDRLDTLTQLTCVTFLSAEDRQKEQSKKKKALLVLSGTLKVLLCYFLYRILSLETLNKAVQPHSVWSYHFLTVLYSRLQRLNQTLDFLLLKCIRDMCYIYCGTMEWVVSFNKNAICQ